MPGLVQGDNDTDVRFVTPEAEGAYQLFVQVRSGKSRTGDANAPFYVRQKP